MDSSVEKMMMATEGIDVDIIIEAMRKIKQQKQRRTLERIVQAVKQKNPGITDAEIADCLKIAEQCHLVEKVFDSGVCSYKECRQVESHRRGLIVLSDIVINKIVEVLRNHHPGYSIGDLEKIMQNSVNVEGDFDWKLQLYLLCARLVEDGILIKVGKCFQVADSKKSLKDPSFHKKALSARLFDNTRQQKRPSSVHGTARDGGKKHAVVQKGLRTRSRNLRLDLAKGLHRNSINGKPSKAAGVEQCQKRAVLATVSSKNINFRGSCIEYLDAESDTSLELPQPDASNRDHGCIADEAENQSVGRAVELHRLRSVRLARVPCTESDSQLAVCVDLQQQQVDESEAVDKRRPVANLVGPLINAEFDDSSFDVSLSVSTLISQLDMEPDPIAVNDNIVDLVGTPHMASSTATDMHEVSSVQNSCYSDLCNAVPTVESHDAAAITMVGQNVCRSDEDEGNGAGDEMCFTNLVQSAESIDTRPIRGLDMDHTDTSSCVSDSQMLQACSQDLALKEGVCPTQPLPAACASLSTVGSSPRVSNDQTAPDDMEMFSHSSIVFSPNCQSSYLVQNPGNPLGKEIRSSTGSLPVSLQKCTSSRNGISSSCDSCSSCTSHDVQSFHCDTSLLDEDVVAPIHASLDSDSTAAGAIRETPVADSNLCDRDVNNVETALSTSLLESNNNVNENMSVDQGADDVGPEFVDDTPHSRGLVSSGKSRNRRNPVKLLEDNLTPFFAPVNSGKRKRLAVVHQDMITMPVPSAREQQLEVIRKELSLAGRRRQQEADSSANESDCAEDDETIGVGPSAGLSVVETIAAKKRKVMRKLNKSLLVMKRARAFRRQRVKFQDCAGKPSVQVCSNQAPGVPGVIAVRRRGRPPGSTNKRKFPKKWLNRKSVQEVPRNSSNDNLKRRTADVVRIANVDEEDLDMFRKAQLAAGCSLAEPSLLSGASNTCNCLVIGSNELCLARDSPCQRLYLCECCFASFSSVKLLKRHMTKWNSIHIPGNEIYRRNGLSVFEIDGCTSALCHGNLEFMTSILNGTVSTEVDVTNPVYYLLYENDCTTKADRFVGFISKARQNPQLFYRMFTVQQDRHLEFSRFLIDFCYQLCRFEGHLKALSQPDDMQPNTEALYRSFVNSVILDCLGKCIDNNHLHPHVDMICRDTFLALDVVSEALSQLDISVSGVGRCLLPPVDKLLSMISADREKHLAVETPYIQWAAMSVKRRRGRPRLSNTLPSYQNRDQTSVADSAVLGDRSCICRCGHSPSDSGAKSCMKCQQATPTRGSCRKSTRTKKLTRAWSPTAPQSDNDDDVEPSSFDETIPDAQLSPVSCEVVASGTDSDEASPPPAKKTKDSFGRSKERSAEHLKPNSESISIAYMCSSRSSSSSSMHAEALEYEACSVPVDRPLSIISSMPVAVHDQNSIVSNMSLPLSPPPSISSFSEVTNNLMMMTNAPANNQLVKPCGCVHDLTTSLRGNVAMDRSPVRGVVGCQNFDFVDTAVVSQHGCDVLRAGHCHADSLNVFKQLSSSISVASVGLNSNFRFVGSRLNNTANSALPRSSSVDIDDFVALAPCNCSRNGSSSLGGVNSRNVPLPIFSDDYSPAVPVMTAQLDKIPRCISLLSNAASLCSTLTVSSPSFSLPLCAATTSKMNASASFNVEPQSAVASFSKWPPPVCQLDAGCLSNSLGFSHNVGLDVNQLVIGGGMVSSSPRVAPMSYVNKNLFNDLNTSPAKDAVMAGRDSRQNTASGCVHNLGLSHNTVVPPYNEDFVLAGRDSRQNSASGCVHNSVLSHSTVVPPYNGDASLRLNGLGGGLFNDPVKLFGGAHAKADCSGGGQARGTADVVAINNVVCSVATPVMASVLLQSPCSQHPECAAVCANTSDCGSNNRSFSSVPPAAPAPGSSAVQAALSILRALGLPDFSSQALIGALLGQQQQQQSSPVSTQVVNVPAEANVPVIAIINLGTLPMGLNSLAAALPQAGVELLNIGGTPSGVASGNSPTSGSINCPISVQL